MDTEEDEVAGTDDDASMILYSSDAESVATHVSDRGWVFAT